MEKEFLTSARLDCDYYRQDALKALSILHQQERWKCQPVKKVCSAIFNFGAYAQYNIVEFLPKQDDRVPFVTVSEINQPFVDESHLRYVSPEVHGHLKKSQCSPQDVLLSIAGTIGLVGIVPKHLSPLNSNQDLAKLRFLSEIVDPYFAVAFLISHYGQIQLSREAAGAVLKHLYLYNIGTIQITVAAREIQEAIGSLIRKAERLKELAETSHLAANRLLEEFLTWPISLPEENAGFVALGDSTAARLDAKFYLPAYLQIIRHVRQLPSGWQPLSQVLDGVYNGAEVREFVEVGRPYLCVKNIDRGELDVRGAPRILAETVIPEKALIKAGDVLVVRTGSLGQAAFVRSIDEQMGAAISSHFIRLVVRDLSDGPIIAAFLNSGIGRLLQDQIAYGAVQPQISQDEVGAIPVPKWPQNLKGTVSEAHSRWRDYLDESETLVTKATNAVESLIAGTLNERELLAGVAGIEPWLEAHPSPYASK